MAEIKSIMLTFITFLDWYRVMIMLTFVMLSWIVMGFDIVINCSVSL